MSHGRLSVWLLVCATALVGCEDGPPTTEFTLSGYVTDAASGGGLRAAQVRFVSETAYTAATTTDDDGRYEMRIESDSPFGQVRAERPGFGAEEETVYFDTRTRRMDLVLQRVAP